MDNTGRGADLNNQHLSIYDRQLKQLTDDTIRMGELANEMVQIARTSLMTQDDSMLDRARAKDKEVNALDQEIEQRATAILGLQGPMATDLRYVTSAIKIAGALERVGDLAKNITKRSLQLGDYRPQKTLAKMDSMVELITSMIGDALDAFKTHDAAKATAVWKQDDEVDALYDEIFAIMQEEMEAEPDKVTSCTHLIFAAKNLERMADYATRIAKTVHYVTSGRPVNKATLRAASAAKVAEST